MRITVVGARGATGRLVAGYAREHAHDVVEVGEALDRAGLGGAVRSCDAVISTLVVDGAPAGTTAHDLSADLLRVMAIEGVGRLVMASWAGAGGHSSELPLARRLSFAFAPAGRHLTDADTVESDVMLADLEWTIVRAHGLTGAPRTGRYRQVEGPIVPKGAALPRADLAAFLVKTVETGRYARRIVAVAT